MSDLDLRILLALRSKGDLSDPIGPAWLERVALDLTALGGHAVLVLLVLGVAGWLLLKRRRSAALWLVLWSAGATLLNAVLKTLFARARPDVVDHLVVVVTHSFPSGHALMSAAIYLMLVALPARDLAQPGSRRFLAGLAVLLTLLVGSSRVYLGVHWPSDVLGGWVIGALWAWIATKGVAYGRR
jgi:undecaprenyl-diphosphatase